MTQLDQQDVLLENVMLHEEKSAVSGDVLEDFLVLGEDEQLGERRSGGPGGRDMSSSSEHIDSVDLFDQYINKDMLMEGTEGDSSPGLLKMDVPPCIRDVAMLNLADADVFSSELTRSGADSTVRIPDDLTKENMQQWGQQNSTISGQKANSISNEVTKTQQDDSKTVLKEGARQSLTYYQQSEQMLAYCLEFGRTNPFKTVYLNPHDFLPKEGDDDSKLPFTIKVDGIPPVSRVETQIKVDVSISPPPKQFMIHLPTDTITKQKFYLTHDITEYPPEVRNNMLYLETFLLCSSNNKSTYVCSRCVKREQRRAARRKSGVSDNLLWCNNENRRAIIFNNKQVFMMKEDDCNEHSKNFSLMTRIVCYCRHHKERQGFKVLFVLRDANDNILARTTSTNIVIMDKKGTTRANKADPTSSVSGDNRGSDGSSACVKEEDSMTGVTSDYSNAESYTSLHQEESSTSVWLSAPKGMPSPTSITEDSSENVHTDHGPLTSASSFLHSSAAASARTMGYKRPRNSIDVPMRESKSERSMSNSSFLGIPSTSLLQNNQQQTVQQPMFFTQNAASLVQNQVSNPQQLSQVPPALVQQMSNMATQASNVDMSVRPFIQRVIPAQGPTKGGIEVTLLGSNFKPNMIVKFGENRALSTQCWSESTIVTYLPPTSKPGQVLVTVFEKEDDNDEQLLGNMSNSRAIFTYVDDTDRQLIELALQIVGLKMNGKLEDARNIAKKIVGNDGGSSNGSTPGSNISPSGNHGNSYTTDVSTNNSTQVYYSDEMLILKVVKLLNPSSNLSMCNSDGQTMLHLACLKGYFHLTSALVKKGARVDVGDAFGFTPLHFACINGDVKLVRLLVECKANVGAIADNGVDAMELFTSLHVSGSDRSNSYVESTLQLLSSRLSDTTNSDSDDEFKAFGRKMSTSSFHSSMFDTESLDSHDFRFQPNVSKMTEDNLSEDSEYESSCYDDISESDEDASDEAAFDDDTAADPPTNESKLLSLGTNGTDEAGNTTTGSPGEGLPKYEDLFPISNANNGDGKLDIAVQNQGHDAAPDATDSHISETSEDEEEALQVRLNRFFQQRQTFRNDKMLIFFWIPVMVILSSAFLAFYFGRDGNKIHHISETVSEYIRTWMGTTLLGNDRMKAAFRESIHNLQNHRLLGDLNYPA